MRWKYLGRFLVLLIGTTCAAQQVSNSTNDSSKVIQAPEPAQVKPEVHNFWDRENIYLFTGVVVVRGMDYASTRNFQARGRQEILLPKDVVNNSAAFASIEAAGVVTSVGISYVFHRTEHHSLERWVSIVHIGVTSFGDVRNYCLKTHHPHIPNTGP